jgi:hypothetical protein
MPIQRAHSFLVHPSKNVEEQPEISGTRVTQSGKLFTMLQKLYDSAEAECEIPIVFRRDADGRQVNGCRNSLIDYLSDPTMAHGRAIATRLQVMTTLRSGLGLVFVLSGAEQRRKTLLIARFPADQGVIAQEFRDRLDVQFIERVFMKSSKAFKAAYYVGTSLQGDFWDGVAVDKQLNNPREISNYWIRDFLESELRTTGPAGTKRLAVALRQAIGSASPEVRHELISMANLLRGQQGRHVSGSRLVVRLGLSPEAAAALESAYPRPGLMEETFAFDREEFDRHVTYRSVELSNGALLTAENASFDTVFRRERVAGTPDDVRYSTQGKVVDEKLRKTK